MTVETSSLHRGVAGARHGFLPLPPGADRLELLGQARSVGSSMELGGAAA